MSTAWVIWVNGAHLVLVTTECTRSRALIHPGRLTSGLALLLRGGWIRAAGAGFSRCIVGEKKGFLMDASHLHPRVALVPAD